MWPLQNCPKEGEESCRIYAPVPGWRISPVGLPCWCFWSDGTYAWKPKGAYAWWLRERYAGLPFFASLWPLLLILLKLSLFPKTNWRFLQFPTKKSLTLHPQKESHFPISSVYFWPLPTCFQQLLFHHNFLDLCFVCLSVCLLNHDKRWKKGQVFPEGSQSDHFLKGSLKTVRSIKQFISQMYSAEEFVPGYLY